MLTREQAHELLTWAHAQNPGPWLEHSLNAARAAEGIAKACGMDAELAYILGLLHDVGRYEGITDLHHVVAGHNLMLSRGEPLIARICLTHSFPVKEVQAFSGKLDCAPEEMAFLENALKETGFDDYDRLIQLCDSLGMPDGICTIEERLFEGTLRRGFNDRTLAKWRSFMELKTYFDNLCGQNIYRIFQDEISRRIFGET